MSEDNKPADRSALPRLRLDKEKVRVLAVRTGVASGVVIVTSCHPSCPMTYHV